MDSGKILIDYITISSKVHTFDDFIKIIGMDRAKFEVRTGRYFYSEGLWCDGINIYYGGDINDGCCLEMSGTGCRTFETQGNSNYDALFQLIKDHPDDVNISRFDIAYDDREEALDLNVIKTFTENQSYISKFRQWQTINGSEGKSVNFGSQKSNVYLRIYDKAMERGKDEHWIRCEMQLRGSNAKAFALSDIPIGERYSGVLRNYIRFTVDNDTDSNRWRNVTVDWWDSFLGDVRKIQIYEKPGTEYNLYNLQSYVVTQAGGAIDCYVSIYGIQDLIDRIKERAVWPNQKYQHLKQLYGGNHGH